MYELIPIISMSKNDQTTNPVEPKQKSSILDKFPKSLKYMPSYIKANLIKSALIITATPVAVFAGGGSVATGGVAAGVISFGSLSLIAWSSFHGRDEKIKAQLEKIRTASLAQTKALDVPRHKTMNA